MIGLTKFCFFILSPFRFSSDFIFVFRSLLPFLVSLSDPCLLPFSSLLRLQLSRLIIGEDLVGMRCLLTMSVSSLAQDNFSLCLLAAYYTSLANIEDAILNLVSSTYSSWELWLSSSLENEKVSDSTSLRSSSRSNILKSLIVPEKITTHFFKKLIESCLTPWGFEGWPWFSFLHGVRFLSALTAQFSAHFLVVSAGCVRGLSPALVRWLIFCLHITVLSVHCTVL